jgi:hypothetical protein
MKLFQYFLISYIILIMHIKKKVVLNEYLMCYYGTKSLNRMMTVTDVNSIQRKLCGIFIELLRGL